MSANFIDTSVVVYIASQDEEKAARAEAVVGWGGIVSVQVLNELANVCRRKMRLDWTETRRFLEAVRGCVSVQPVSHEVHLLGIDVAERYGLSVYDGMIVAAALEAESEILWSEDMHDGLVVFDRLTIVNPFRRGTLTPA